jgi:transcriptional regulator with XRE-family HTH domain
MKISDTLSDDAVLEELGRRLQRHRLDRNITQSSLAREAGISTPTLQRLEAGSSVQFVSLLRVLRGLGLLEQVETLVPAPHVRPMELLERKGRQRKRASSGGSSDTNEPWTWED